MVLSRLSRPANDRHHHAVVREHEALQGRNLLLSTVGMMRLAMCVAAFSFRFTMMRAASANVGCACDTRPRSSARNRSCGQMRGMASKKFASERSSNGGGVVGCCFRFRSDRLWFWCGSSVTCSPPRRIPAPKRSPSLRVEWRSRQSLLERAGDVDCVRACLWIARVPWLREYCDVGEFDSKCNGAC